MSAESLVIVALSDTHGLHAAMEHDIPEGDVLIHAGDFCGRGLVEEVVEFAHWMGSLPHRHKLATAGNHDRPVEESERL
ncbi:MAG: metallophosphoesterase, partial [Verrucomicrobiae bacterium]|nr:metallophosphoesterase [Verrucomicrobiae bacterium]